MVYSNVHLAKYVVLNRLTDKKSCRCLIQLQSTMPCLGGVVLVRARVVLYDVIRQPKYAQPMAPSIASCIPL